MWKVCPAEGIVSTSRITSKAASVRRRLTNPGSPGSDLKTIFADQTARICGALDQRHPNVTSPTRRPLLPGATAGDE
jgi:hypothetical protein